MLIVKEEFHQLKFKFNSIIKAHEMPISFSLAEVYFNEHYDEIEHRIYHIFNFLFIVAVISFSNIKPLVKILEEPVSNIQFFQSSPGEYFLSTIIIAIYTGLLFCIPFILGQTILFFSPSLKKSQIHIIRFLFVNSVFLFLFGLLFSYFILIPAALKFFIFYASEVLEPFLSFNEYFNFASTIFFTTTLVFQIPIIQIILSIFTIYEPRSILKYWRSMLLLSTILGAILTPSADPITQLLLSGAFYFLFYLGTFISISLTKHEKNERYNKLSTLYLYHLIL